MANQIKLLDTPNGDPKGECLFIVTTIDTDDSEDTTSEIWQANDEHHLYDLVRESYVGEEYEEEEFFGQSPSDRFEEDWGINILFNHIANII
jgi:hypothetical protein